ncbi:Plasmodium vivax Vir protein, putative [Plasmodium vivax]|uniref:Vir protein, putative n=1 Tax=Plasmodium vivax TaxID=5855 RepID=A0A1G4EC15_PLAVI|nr:Plasmodium vivax Vir protein, putative [Plasmodium vivax]
MATQPCDSKYSIKELPSERFYDWLDDYFMSILRHSSDCNTLSSPYKDNHEIKRLCSKIVKYITSKPPIFIEKHLKDHHCNLFNYWIYEQLVKECDGKSIDPALVFGNFLFVLSGLQYYLKDNTCKLNSSIPMMPDRQDRKELYEYCIDCDKILEKSKYNKDTCKKYCTYVEKKIPLYEKFQKLCSSSDQTKCPDFYKKCEPHNPKVLLELLKCKDEMVNEKQQLKDNSGTTSNSSLSSQSVSNLSNAFLGVVVTSMTSGFLYKVNTNLIKINR